MLTYVADAWLACRWMALQAECHYWKAYTQQEPAVSLASQPEALCVTAKGVCYEVQNE